MASERRLPEEVYFRVFLADAFAFFIVLEREFNPEIEAFLRSQC